MIQDITPEEEANLPLPHDWIRSINSASSEVVYKNRRTSNESEEHPFITQALNAARKLPLPSGWVVQQTQLDDGTMDYFYCNASLGISNWDPPHLRQCLAEVLSSHGFKQAASQIYPTFAEPSQSANSPTRGLTVNEAYQRFREGKSVSTPMITNRAPADMPLGDIGSSLRDFTSSDHPLSKEVAHADYKNDEDNYDDMRIEDLQLSPMTLQVSWQAVHGPANVIENPANEANPSSDEPRRTTTVSFDENDNYYYDDDYDDIEIVPQDEEASHSDEGGDPSVHDSHKTPDDQGSIRSARSVRSGGQAEATGVDGEDNGSTVYSAVEPSTTSIQRERRGRSEKWEMIKQASLAAKDDSRHKQTYRRQFSKPPINEAGIRVLRADAVLANDRVQELLTNLRTQLTARSGQDAIVVVPSTVSTFIDTPTDQADEADLRRALEQALPRAGQVIEIVRNHPEYLLATMNNSTPGSLAMAFMAFTVLHRLLHPFCSDPSITTGLLLEAIGYQIDETAEHVKKSFPDSEVKLIMSRVMFISDPVTAMNWNPLGQPMPLLPNVPSEPSLTCLLRTYAIRRDVASYYRTIWRPVLPAVAAITRSAVIDGARTFANIFAVATRLLDCTFNIKGVMMFPPIASAVCHSLLEIGGRDAMYNYVINLLLLPNILKIISDGDHESFDNELIYHTPAHLEEYYDRYFDLNLWWPPEGFTSVKYDPFSALVWTIWRLLSAACCIDDKTLLALQSKDFFVGGPLLDTSGVTDFKLRAALTKLRRKTMDTADLISQVPLDAFASEYLGVNAVHSIRKLEERVQILGGLNSVAGIGPALSDGLKRRLIGLLQKPPELLSTVLISSFELTTIFNDICEAIEQSGQVEESQIYKFINDFMRPAIQYRDYIEKARAQAIDSLPGQDATVEIYLSVPVPVEPYNMNEYIHQPENANIAREEMRRIRELHKYLDRNPQQLHSAMAADDGSIGSYLMAHGTESILSNPQPSVASKSAAIVLTYRYQQLMSGLTLANRYEDSLLRMLRKLENNERTSILDLVDDGSWCQFPEFDPTVNTAEVAENISHLAKHTAASGKKAANPHFGLGKDYRPNGGQGRPKQWQDVSLKSLHESMFSTFRFGTPSSKAAVGTSMARVKLDGTSACLPPSPSTQASLPAGNRRHSNRSGNGYVSSLPGQRGPRGNLLFDVRPDAAFLNPTESVRHQHDKQAPNPAERQKAYIQSFRDHAVIPTDKFLQRKRRLIERSTQRNRQSRQTMTAGSKYNAQPFPEHLRHRVRPEDNAYKPQETYADDDDPSDDITNLIRDYANVFAPNSRQSGRGRIDSLDRNGLSDDQLPSNQEYDQDNYDSGSPDNRSRSGSSTGYRNPRPSSPLRSRSPAVPEPIPGVNYLAPTAALLHKLASETEEHSSKDFIRAKFFRDIDEGYTPGLRESADDRLGAVSPQPFRPSGKKIAPATGPRIPRVVNLSGREMGSDSEGASFSSSRRGRSRNRDRSDVDDVNASADVTPRRSKSRERISPPRDHADEAGHDASRAKQPVSPSPHVISVAGRTPSNRPTTSRPLRSTEESGTPNYSRPTASADPTRLVRTPSPTSQSRRNSNPLATAESSSRAANNGSSEANQASPTRGPGDVANAPTAPHRNVNIASEPPKDSSKRSTATLMPIKVNATLESSKPGILTPEPPSKSSASSGANPTNHPFYRAEPNNVAEGLLSNEPHSESDRSKSSEASGSGQNEDPYAPAPNVPAQPVKLERRGSVLRNKDEWKDKLLVGIQVIKHGKSGSSKEKILILDSNEEYLCWCARRRRSLFSFGSTSDDVANSDSRIRVDSITEVRRGVQTEVLLKIASRVDPACSLSLVTLDRSLDLTFPSCSERDIFLRGLKLWLHDSHPNVRFF